MSKPEESCIGNVSSRCENFSLRMLRFLIVNQDVISSGLL